MPKQRANTTQAETTSVTFTGAFGAMEINSAPIEISQYESLVPLAVTYINGQFYLFAESVTNYRPSEWSWAKREIVWHHLQLDDAALDPTELQRRVFAHEPIGWWWRRYHSADSHLMRDDYLCRLLDIFAWYMLSSWIGGQ